MSKFTRSLIHVAATLGIGIIMLCIAFLPLALALGGFGYAILLYLPALAMLCILAAAG